MAKTPCATHSSNITRHPSPIINHQSSIIHHSIPEKLPSALLCIFSVPSVNSALKNELRGCSDKKRLVRDCLRKCKLDEQGDASSIAQEG
jgi:hypothetical protein